MMSVSINSYSKEKDKIYRPKITKTKKRNVFWPPLVSFLLPGFDQYL